MRRLRTGTAFIEQELTAANAAMVALPPSLRKMAAIWINEHPSSRTAEHAAIRDIPSAERGMTIPNAAIAVSKAAALVQVYLRKRRGGEPARCGNSWKQVVTFVGDVNKRCAKQIRQLAMRAYKEVIRTSVNPGPSFFVKLNDEKPGAEVAVESAGRYSSRCTWTKQLYITTLRLGAKWYLTVHKNGMARVDKYFIASARLMYVTSAGVSVYDALAVKNTRGNGVETVPVRLMRGNGVIYCETNSGAWMTLPAKAAAAQRKAR